MAKQKLFSTARDLLAMLFGSVYTLIFRASSAAFGFLQIVAVLFFLSPEDQGIYYSMLGLIGLQVFGSMGLNIAQIHFMSGLSPNLRNNALIPVERNPKNQEFFFILRFTLKWYSTAAFFMLIALVPLGLLFYERANLLNFNVGLTWIGLCFFASFNFFVIWLTTIHEGLGNVEKASQARLLQLLISNSFIWVSLSVDWGLVSFAIGNTIGVLVVFVFLSFDHRFILANLFRFCIRNIKVRWKSTFWSFQWRIGVSWISGFFIINLFNPLILFFHGPVLAGQFGLSLHVVRSLASIANAVVEVQQPKYGKLLTEGLAAEMDVILKKTTAVSLTIFSIGVLGFLIGMQILSSYVQGLEHRLLPSSELLLLSIIVGSSLVSLSISVYLRSHKLEPFLGISVLNALVTICLSLLLVPFFKTHGAIISYFCGTVIIGLIGALIIFAKFRNTMSYGSLFR